MKHQKVFNLLNEAGDSKFVTRKWNLVNDQSSAIMKDEIKLSIRQKH